MARLHKAGVEVLSVTEPDIDSDDATRGAGEAGSRCHRPVRACPHSLKDGHRSGSEASDRWLRRRSPAFRLARRGKGACGRRAGAGCDFFGSPLVRKD